MGLKNKSKQNPSNYSFDKKLWNVPNYWRAFHFSFLTQTLRTTDYATKACLTLGFEEAALWQDRWHIVYTDDSTHGSNLDMNNMKILIVWIQIKILKCAYKTFWSTNFWKFIVGKICKFWTVNSYCHILVFSNLSKDSNYCWFLKSLW